MERKTITIGRETDNTVQINKPDISSHHVRITRTDENSFYVEDLGSANHTFVDDMPIRKATIGLEEKLRLSKNTPIDLKEIFQIGDKKPTTSEPVYIESFLKLKTLWEATERRKKQIRRKQQIKSALIRTGITLAFVAIALPFHSSLGATFTGIVIAAGGIASAFVPIASSDELRTLDERLHSRYVCPYCGSKFGQWSWNYYADNDKCPNQNCKKSFKIINN